MNYGSVQSAQWNGINAEEVRIECTQTLQLPTFRFSGAASGAAAEMRDRLIAAFSSCGLRLPSKRIIIGFTPRVKSSAIEMFDLPVALAVLVAAKMIPANSVAGLAFLGQLGLDGSLMATSGMEALAAEMLGGVLVPWQASALLRPEQLQRGGGFKSLKEVLAYLRSTQGSGRKCLAEEVLSSARPEVVRLEDIFGQVEAKHMAVIAAAGGHACMLTGPHGWGKSLLARAIWGLLPELSDWEQKELRRIYSSGGVVPVDFRPLRSVDASYSERAILGGGRVRIGEIGLAHRGVLFLDELLEWPRPRLEALRIPLESGVAKSVVVAATNTCPCGRQGSSSLICHCKPHEVHRYRRRLSGAFLDRFDLAAEVSDREFHDVFARAKQQTTEVLRAKILTARTRMMERQVVLNSELRGERAFEAIPWSGSALKLAQKMFVARGLTRRGYAALLRTALTVCDLRDGARVEEGDVFEAAHFRPDRLMLR